MVLTPPSGICSFATTFCHVRIRIHNKEAGSPSKVSGKPLFNYWTLLDVSVKTTDSISRSSYGGEARWGEAVGALPKGVATTARNNILAGKVQKTRQYLWQLCTVQNQRGMKNLGNPELCRWKKKKKKACCCGQSLSACFSFSHGCSYCNAADL